MAKKGRKKKGFFRRAFNRIFHLGARFLPGATTVRPFLHQLRGVNIEGDVFIGEEVYIENEHPECVTLKDQAQIALRSTIMAHFRGPGKVIVGEKVWIGAHSLIAANAGETIVIGEGSALAANSVVTKSIPPFTFVGGIPAKPIARITVPMTVDTGLDEFKAGLKPLKGERDDGD